MLSIRPLQLDVLRTSAGAQFETEMVEHARGFAPGLTAAAGPENVALTVRAALKKADRYGLTDRGPVRLIFELMLSFGSEFDTDPLLPWASPALLDGKRDQMTRALRLHSAMMAYRHRVMGSRGHAAIAALKRARHWVPGDIDQFSGAEAEERLLLALRETYPDRCEYAGSAAIDAVVERATEAAKAAGLVNSVSIALITGVLFGFGHGALADPLYPWIGATLRDTRVPEPLDRLTRLHRKVNIYVDRVIETLG